MDPSGSGALIALRSAAEGLRALGDTPQHRPQSPPNPPVGFGADRISLLSVPMSDRCAAQCPQPRASRAAVRAVPWGGGGGAVRGSVAVLGPPGTAPPLPLCHTRSEEGAARSARTDAGPGKGPGSPIGPTVCVWGRAVWGGWRGGGVGGRHLGVTAAAGTGRACSGPAADVSSADKQPESGGDKRLLCSRPSGRTSSAGAEPPPPFIPPLPFLPPALSVGWAADCRPGGVGSGCGMRDAAVGAQRTEQPSSPSAELMLPPPSRSPPPTSPPPVGCRRFPPRGADAVHPRSAPKPFAHPSPAAGTQSRAPPHRTQLLPAQPPDPPTPPPRGSTRLAPAGLCPRCATRRAVLMGVV